MNLAIAAGLMQSSKDKIKGHGGRTGSAAKPSHHRSMHRRSRRTRKPRAEATLGGV